MNRLRRAHKARLNSDLQRRRAHFRWLYRVMAAAMVATALARFHAIRATSAPIADKAALLRQLLLDTPEALAKLRARFAP